MKKAKILMLLLFTIPMLSIGQTTNLVNGVPVTVTSGTSNDHIIPADAGSIEVSVRGADGGGVRFSGIFCDDVTIRGGQAITAKATFEVGNSAGQIPPGSRLRSFNGSRGNGFSLACGGPGAFWGGGGGSSAILYLPPGQDPAGMNWRMLVVAGGGGGAARPSAGFDWIGGGATNNEKSGGSGTSVEGATDGNRGNTNGLAAEVGYGYKPIATIPATISRTMVAAFDAAQSPILVQLQPNSKWSETSTGAGNGFTGGGKKSSANNGVGRGGAGGGGFSGGSTEYNRGGGGGGSHIASGLNIISSSFSGGGSGQGTASNGSITIKSNPNPIVTAASCQNQTVQLDINGQASFNVSQLNNGSTGNLPLSFTVNGQTSINYTCSDIGSTGVTLTLTDARGKTSSCVATVTVEDKVGPIASCQNTTVQLNANGKGFINSCLIDLGSADACGGFIGYALDKTTFDCSNLGTNTVTMTVTDLNGNSSSCTSTVTVQDQMKPVASCKNTTIQLDASGNASITTLDINNGSTDGCGIGNMSLDQSTFGCSQVGTNTVSLTVTDLSNNSSQCLSTVTVEDKVAPVAKCKDITLQLSNDGNRMLTAADIDNGSTDACGIALRSLAVGSYSCAKLGTNTETLTVTDVNGNSSSCTSKVTVLDQTAPIAQCKDMTVQLDANGASPLITASDINNGSSDDCSGVASMSLNQTSFSCTQVGVNTVTLTVTDASGNVGTCTAAVTVEDKIVPSITCPANIVVNNDPGNCGAVVNYASPTFADNCANNLNLFRTNGLGSGASFPVGTTTESYNTTDASGNSSSCSFTVTVNKIGDADLLSAYTVIGLEGVKMEANIVQSGGVGVVQAEADVQLKKGSVVTASNTFVKAPSLELAGGSQATTVYQGQVASNLLPTFATGNFCNNDLEIPANGGVITLDQACYGKIFVGENTSIIFSGHAKVNIERIELDKGVSVSFGQATDLLLEKQFLGGENLWLSNGGHEVWIFAKGKVSVGAGSDVTANIYTKKNLQVEGGEPTTTMTGLFISAEIVNSKDNVIWNWNPACLATGGTPGNVLTLTAAAGGQADQTKEASQSFSTVEKINELSISPNPFVTETNIRFILSEAGPTTLSIYSMNGQLVRQLQNQDLTAGEHRVQWDGTDRGGSQVPSSMYLVQLRVGEEVLTKKVVLQQR